MFWLGDLTRDVDYYSDWGLNYRASHDRAIPFTTFFARHAAVWHLG
jgi:hypothetical protein